MPAQSTDRAERPYLLIDYEWRSELDADLREQVSRFAAEAADFDAEAGFTRISEFRRPTPAARTDDRPRRLLVYVDEDAQTRTLAAYLSIEHVDDDGNAEAALVVAPAYRSLGIATLLAETLIADGGGEDWFGTGVRRLALTAAGPHPASERLANRFGVAQERERWEFARRLREPVGHPEMFDGPRIADSSRDEPTNLNAVQVGEMTYGAALDAATPQDPASDQAPTIRRGSYRLAEMQDRPTAELITRVNVRTDRPSYLGFVEFVGAVEHVDESDLEALIEAGLSDLWAVGVRSVFAFVDPKHEALVKVLRRTYFVHDQTNTTYLVDVANHRQDVSASNA